MLVYSGVDGNGREAESCELPDHKWQFSEEILPSLDFISTNTHRPPWPSGHPAQSWHLDQGHEPIISIESSWVKVDGPPSALSLPVPTPSNPQ